MDYEQREIAGLSWEVVPTPGAPNGARSYVVELDGARLAAPAPGVEAVRRYRFSS